MSDIRHGAPVTLAQIHQELKDMGFDDDDQCINGGDFVEYGGQLFADLCVFLAQPTMAERWVARYNEWQDSELTSAYDFGDWLDKAHPGERETLTWIANWDSRPVDGQLKADPRRATSFAVMDFGDGSIAIKRGFGNDLERRTWMVAS